MGTRPLTYDYRQQYGRCAACNHPCDPCNAYTIQVDQHVYHTRCLRNVFTLCADCYQRQFPWALPVGEANDGT